MTVARSPASILLLVDVAPVSGSVLELIRPDTASVLIMALVNATLVNGGLLTLITP